MNKIIALKDEYDALVERLIKADEVMNNLFTLQEKKRTKAFNRFLCRVISKTYVYNEQKNNRN